VQNYGVRNRQADLFFPPSFPFSPMSALILLKPSHRTSTHPSLHPLDTLVQTCTLEARQQRLTAAREYLPRAGRVGDGPVDVRLLSLFPFLSVPQPRTAVQEKED
jgi:hypothetical protein